MVIGNSSRGIYEAPSFGIPTINIGNRQKGRTQAASIINCKPVKEEIIEAISKAYSMNCDNTINPYEKDNTANNIIEILKNYKFDEILKKEFYEL